MFAFSYDIRVLYLNVSGDAGDACILSGLCARGQKVCMRDLHHRHMLCCTGDSSTSYAGIYTDSGIVTVHSSSGISAMKVHLTVDIE